MGMKIEKEQRKIAKRIVALEKKIYEVESEKDKDILRKRLESITSHLSFSDMLAIDEYIMKYKLEEIEKSERKKKC